MKVTFVLCVVLGFAAAAVSPRRQAMLNPALFEGDIKGMPDTDLQFKVAANLESVKYAAQRWPNGIVPYQHGNEYTAWERNVIESAFRQIESDARVNGIICVQFKPRTTETSYLTFEKGSSCSSWVGRMNQQPQSISLGSGCIYKGTIMHELLHALGFWHTQSRPDRDTYVTVQWNNIYTDNQHNFNKYDTSTVTSLGLPYDLDSIMHYGAYDFSKNGYPTIISNDPSKGANMGETNDLSEIDIAGIQILYGCKAPIPTTSTSTSLWDKFWSWLG